MQRALLLEERETLVQSMSPGSAAGSYGTARVVASYSIVECMGGGVTGSALLLCTARRLAEILG